MLREVASFPSQVTNITRESPLSPRTRPSRNSPVTAQDVRTAPECEIDLSTDEPVELAPGYVDAAVGLLKPVCDLGKGLHRVRLFQAPELREIEGLEGQRAQGGVSVLGIRPQVPLAEHLDRLAYHRVRGGWGVEDPLE